MDISAAEGWAAPAATIVAALVAGAFARVANRGRLDRLKVAIEIREDIGSSQLSDWDYMIARDVEGVVRQASRPPVLAYVVAWLGLVTWRLGSTQDNALLLFGGAAASIVGLGWLVVWWIREWRSHRAITNRLASEIERYKKQVTEDDKKLTELRHKEAALSDRARTLLLASGAPMSQVDRAHSQLLDDLDAGQRSEDPSLLMRHVKRPTWRLRRWYRARQGRLADISF